jgi:hypothetical protein
MNGVYCCSRPMRINEATPKKSLGFQQSYYMKDPNATDEDLRQGFWAIWRNCVCENRWAKDVVLYSSLTGPLPRKLCKSYMVLFSVNSLFGFLGVDLQQTTN